MTKAKQLTVAELEQRILERLEENIRNKNYAYISYFANQLSQLHTLSLGYRKAGE